MGHELGDARGSDQAAWLDLVARLERPAAAGPVGAPWPDRENLASAAAGEQAAPVPPADRSRVIRPASFLRSADSAGTAAGTAAGSAAGSAADPDGEEAAAGRAPATEGDAGPAEETWSDDPEPWRPTARNLSAEDYINLADLGYLDYDAGDAGDRYVPPPVPPQPRLDPVAKAAWIALLGGPGYLFLATLLGWQVPGWAQLAAIIAFVAGFVVLVVRLGDGPSRRDGPDQGAVV
jgi:hypothetical protein